MRGLVELGAWQRKNLRQSPRLLFFPWTAISDLPEQPKRTTKSKASVADAARQGIETALRYQSLLNNGTVKTRAELARHLGVSRARVTQVLKRLERLEN
jgi:Fic family protein